MKLNKNKYEPETDFEKKEFSELIDKITKLDEDIVSENFDEKFFKELRKVKPIKSFRSRIEEMLTSSLQKRRVKAYAAAATAVVIFLFIIIVPFKKTPSPEKVLTQKDTVQIDHEKNKVRSENLTTPSGKISKTFYWQGLMKDLNQKYGLALSDKNNSSQLLKDISESELFKKNTKETKSFNRADTLKLLLQMIRNTKK